MRIPLILLAALVALMLAGSDPGAEPWPAASTPDDLIANLEQALNDRNIDEYARLLHPDFEFVFAPGEHPALSRDSSWAKDRELESMARLFAGEPGTNRHGRQVPGLEEIEFALVAVSDWDYRSLELETWTRHYHAFAKVYYEDGTRRVITREQVFTLTAKRSESDLAPAGFRMLRWEELGCDCPDAGMPRVVKSRF